VATRSKSGQGKPAPKKRGSTPTAKRKSPVKPKLPPVSRMQRPQADAELGEQVFLLKVPFEERQLASWGGAKYYSGYGFAFIGQALPPSLKRFEAPAYSWEAYVEADLAGAGPGSSKASLDNGDFTLRPDQIEDRNQALRALKAGAPEFVIGSDTGVGKTVTAIAILKATPARNILVVAPLAVIANWRLHLKLMGDGGKRWALINYDSAKNLLEKPPAKISSSTGKPVQSSKATLNRAWAREGAAKVAWDVVVADESHLLANPMSQRTAAIERVIAGPTGAPPALVLRLSATAGANPAKLSYLHRGLAYVSGEKPLRATSATAYAKWCEQRGIAVSVDRYDNLTWESNERDLAVMHDLIYRTGGLNWALRRVPEGWPEQQRNRVPVEFDGPQMDAYEEAWEEFLATMDSLGQRRTGASHRASRATPSDAAKGRLAARAAQIRYRQKAGLIRAPQTVDFVASLLENDLQVAVNCEFRGTVEAIRAGLEAKKIGTALFVGGDPHREQQRLAFQQGAVKCIIFTPDSGISLHANETSVGGTSTERALVVAEPRWAPTPALQIEGRTQRNGEAALAYYPYAVNTIEERVIKRVIQGMRNVKMINGDDTSALEALGAEMGVYIDSEREGSAAR